MHSYGVRDVEKLLRVSRGTLRALIAAGFVSPARGPRNTYQFSFQDLIVLRTAQALSKANVPQRRIFRALKELRARLPENMPLSGLSLGAIADEVVVREGDARWQAETGQYVLAFDAGAASGALRDIEPAIAAASEKTDAILANTASADASYIEATTLEANDSEAAIRAYQRAIEADPKRMDARINLGRLQHESGHLGAAVDTYLAALRVCGADALLLFNLAVLLDDVERKPEAVRAYEAALKLDPELADGHYNLALLYEDLGQPKLAIRHMSQYRRLVKVRD